MNPKPFKECPHSYSQICCNQQTMRLLNPATEDIQGQVFPDLCFHKLLYWQTWLLSCSLAWSEPDFPLLQNLVHVSDQIARFSIIFKAFFKMYCVWRITMSFFSYTNSAGHELRQQCNSQQHTWAKGFFVSSSQADWEWNDDGWCHLHLNYPLWPWIEPEKCH